MTLDVRKPKGYRRAWNGGINLTRTVTVCDACLCASCWQGRFYCDAYRSAGTRQLTLAELHELNREDASYWFTSPTTGIVSHAALELFRKYYPVPAVSENET